MPVAAVGRGAEAQSPPRIASAQIHHLWRATPKVSIPDIRHTSYGPQATRKSWRSREIERSPSASAGLRLPKLAPRPIAFLDERGAQLPLSTNDGVHPRLRIVIGRELS